MQTNKENVRPTSRRGKTTQGASLNPGATSRAAAETDSSRRPASKGRTSNVQSITSLSKMGGSLQQLISKLKATQSKLASIQQENADTESLTELTQELSSQILLEHKDRTVRVLTACCLADILRIYAPDAPYSQAELRRIFELFIRELENLNKKSDPLYSHYYYVLESLSTVRSCVLVNDLNADELVHDFFKVFLKIVSTDMQKNAYMNILDILKELVEENSFLSMEIVDLILNCYRKKRQTEAPAAFNLVVDLCSATTDKMQRYASQYFTEKISDDFSGENSLENPVNRKTFERAHRLIIEIGKHSPDILISVIPILESELTVADNYIRLAATKILGELFAIPNGSFARTYSSTWKMWMGRIRDQELIIRSLIVEYTPTLIASHPNLASDLDTPLKDSIIDKDEKMRIAVLKTLKTFSLFALRHVDSKLLTLAGTRICDKKPNVRIEAVKTMAHIFSAKYQEISGTGLSEFEPEDKYLWIPSEFLNSMYTVRDDLTFKAVIDNALALSVFPPDSNDALRTQRLLHILSACNERQFAAFVNFLDRQSKSIDKMVLFLNLSEMYNGGVILTKSSQLALLSKYGASSGIKDALSKEVLENLLTAIITHIASLLPDPRRAEGQLKKIVATNDGRLYKLFRILMNPQSEYTNMLKLRAELIKKIDQVLGTSTASVLLANSDENSGLTEESALSLEDTFTENMVTLVSRVSLTVISKGTIPACMTIIADSKNRVQSDEDEQAQKNDISNVAEQLLKVISEKLPSLYQSNLDKLVDLLKTRDGNGPGDSQILDEACEALCRFSKSYPNKLAFIDQSTIDRLCEIAKSQASISQVPNVIVILCYLFRHSKSDRQTYLYDLCSEIVRTLMLQLKRVDKSSINTDNVTLENSYVSSDEEDGPDSDSSSSDLPLSDEDVEDFQSKRSQPSRAVKGSNKRRKLLQTQKNNDRKLKERKMIHVNNVYKENIDKLRSTLLGLSEFSYYLPGMMSAHKLSLTNFIVREILLRNDDLINERSDWKAYDKIPAFGKLKLTGLQVLLKQVSLQPQGWAPISSSTDGSSDGSPAKGVVVAADTQDLASSSNGTTSQASDTQFKSTIDASHEYAAIFAIPDSQRLTAAKSVSKLFKKIINNEGELLSGDDETPLYMRSALRLQAAQCMLLLAKDKELCKIDEMLYIALTMQDTVFKVRCGIVNSLCEHIDRRDVPFKFVTLLCIMAHEPETDLKNKSLMFLKRTALRQRREIINAVATTNSVASNSARGAGVGDETGAGDQTVSSNINFQSIAGQIRHPLVEHTLPRVLYLLSKHPDFTDDPEDLTIFVKYIEFYLNAILSDDCVSFLYYVAAKMKMYRDINGDMQSSRNIYILSEASQLIIQKKAKQHQWSLDAFSGHAMVPLELYSKLTPQEAADNSKLRYLPESFK